MTVNRRIAIGSIVGSLVAMKLPSVAYSQGTLRKRHGATTQEGKANLKIYASAVKRMMDTAATPATSHMSWLFQWYTHFVRGDRDKLNEIKAIFGDADSPQKDLANLMWSSCRAHSGGFQAHFLPWHRAYLVCFEDIVRQVSQQEDFTLPYWDYTNDSRIPEEFTKKGDPELDKLFIANRNDFINEGRAINDVAPGLLNLDSLAVSAFAAFSSDLDGNLHGLLHGAVGTTTNMGRVPYAAGDPIFWLHHCNIDRVWASWNKLGGKNPTADEWQDTVKHTFADRHGNRYERTNSELADTVALGYEYDSLLTLPASAAAAPMLVSDQGSKTLARAAGPVALGGQRSAAQLEPVSSAASAEVQNLDVAKERLVLVIGDLKAPPTSSAGLFKVYASVEGEVDDQSAFVGYISFFEANNPDSNLVLKMNNVVAAALQRGKDVDLLRYQFVPVKETSNGGEATIGRLELIKN